jgi:hypothetical protein
MSFEPNALYILLTWQDSSTSWHWMIYMFDAPDGDEGFAVHLGQAVDGPTFMQGQSRERRQRDRVFTCRVFVMNLIEKLASAGHIQCAQFLELEDEVKALALEASSGFRRGMVPKYYNSAYSRAITH